jgi:hypothetical protein
MSGKDPAQPPGPSETNGKEPAKTPTKKVASEEKSSVAERQAWWEFERKEKEAKKSKERQQLEDERTRISPEKQTLLSSLQYPLIQVLEDLGVKDELSIALAVGGVATLDSLRHLDQVTLANTLGLDDIARQTGRDDLEEVLESAILAARRDFAMRSVAELKLPDDDIFEHVEVETDTVQAPFSEKLSTFSDFMPASVAANAIARSQEKGIEGSENIRVKDGPLRKQLKEVAGCWHDYLATEPALGSTLAAQDSAFPSWKETASWATWMLTSRSMGEKHGSENGWMSRTAIETNLRLAKEHVWCAQLSN